jgi:hypothetical protein
VVLMALGNNKPRNWGKESQLAALSMLCQRRRVDYLTIKKKARMYLCLFKKDYLNNIQLPVEWECELVNERRGRWSSYSSRDGKLIASGVSQRDAILRTIALVWQ